MSKNTNDFPMARRLETYPPSRTVVSVSRRLHNTLFAEPSGRSLMAFDVGDGDGDDVDEDVQADANRRLGAANRMIAMGVHRCHLCI
jgi:hypothetical protein